MSNKKETYITQVQKVGSWIANGRDEKSLGQLYVGHYHGLKLKCYGLPSAESRLAFVATLVFPIVIVALYQRFLLLDNVQVNLARYLGS